MTDNFKPKVPPPYQPSGAQPTNTPQSPRSSTPHPFDNANNAAPQVPVELTPSRAANETFAYNEQTPTTGYVPPRSRSGFVFAAASAIMVVTIGVAVTFFRLPSRQRAREQEAQVLETQTNQAEEQLRDVERQMQAMREMAENARAFADETRRLHAAGSPAEGSRADIPRASELQLRARVSHTRGFAVSRGDICAIEVKRADPPFANAFCVVTVTCPTSLVLFASATPGFVPCTWQQTSPTEVDVSVFGANQDEDGPRTISVNTRSHSARVRSHSQDSSHAVDVEMRLE